ncbi:MAG: RagB/SusD family nutrient uptake outer membrane protein [Tannerella sp.]|uniref:RagB/SusD family nutrient uptake outer membrane protein n=1 Tax=Tannerella sp. TaxID=2382127 RepID=UPI003FA2EAB0
MKNKIIIAGLFVFLFGTSSCNDFLKEDPKGKLTLRKFTSQKEVDLAVTALYSKVAQMQANTNLTAPNFMQGDDATTNPGSNKMWYAEIDGFRPTDGNIALAQTWAGNYTLIKAANYVLENIDETPISEEEKNIAVGQAKFWRAIAYFNLVRIWGPLPLIIKNEVDQKIPLSSEKDVYEKIIVPDLLDCQKLLPTNYTTEPGKLFGVNTFVTYQAARATLSAVYMAMAGWPINETAYYAKAATEALAVIEGVEKGQYEYILEPEFKFVYDITHNYTQETVLGVNANGLFADGEGTSFCNTQLFESQGGWGDFWGEIRFWKRMPEGPRKDAVYSSKILYQNKLGNPLINWWEKDDKGNWLVPELHPMFCTTTVSGSGINDVQDYDYTKGVNMCQFTSQRRKMIRYAEVLLWYAESQARSTGTPSAKAYECVNRVRKRAGLPALAPGLSGQTFADAALAEHGWEVAGYHPALVTRRADQLRMNTLKETFAERVANTPVEIIPGVAVQEKIPITDATWTDNRNYMPYPAWDASLNPNLKR